MSDYIHQPFFEDLTDEIFYWQQKTFPDASFAGAFYKLQDEVSELTELVERRGYISEQLSEELADIFIVLVQVAGLAGVNLYHAVENKMHINSNRKWNIRADGTGQHVKEETE